MEGRSEVQPWIDELAIRDLVARYSDAVSLLDPVRAAATYVAEGRVVIEGVETAGRSTIEQGMRQSFGAFRMLQLIAHGGLVAVDGDDAQARWSTIELGVRHGADEMHCIFGRYEDSLVRTPDGWRFASRRFAMAGRAKMEVGKMQVATQIAALLAPGL